jgi:hypothetical protein
MPIMVRFEIPRQEAQKPSPKDFWHILCSQTGSRERLFARWKQSPTTDEQHQNQMKTKLLQIALIASFLSAPLTVRGQTNLQSVVDAIFAAQNDLIAAAADYQAALQGASAGDIQAALNSLSTASANITDPAVQAALGKVYAALQRALAAAQAKTQAALNAVDENDPANMTYVQKQKVIRNIKIAASSVSSLATLAKKPLILSGGLAVLGNPSTCNMYNHGQLVKMRIELPAGCDTVDLSVINSSNLANNQVVDPATLTMPAQNGVFTFRMGNDWGSAKVQVVACGVTNTTLVYNYGKAPIAGLPARFPQNLPAGTYVMTWWGTIVSKAYNAATGTWETSTTSIPVTAAGTFKMTNLKTFAGALVKAFDLAIASVNQPGCSQSVNYSPFTDDAFTASYTVTCSSTDASATTTVNFTLTKQ